MAGVSPGAPYRHFRDAEALLAEVALRGFERFAAALAAAWNGGRPNRACVPSRRSGRAYLAFARDEPAYYAAMFETRIAFDSHPGLARSRRSCLRHPARGGGACSPQACRRSKRPPSLMVALHVWALSHGIASLFVRADPSRRKLPMSPEELLEAGVLIYLQSLGLAGGSRPGAKSAHDFP